MSKLTYDVQSYQESMQLVRDARDKIDALPETVKDSVLGIARKLVSGTKGVCKEIYTPNTDPNTVKAGGTPGDYITDKKDVDQLELRFK